MHGVRVSYFFRNFAAMIHRVLLSLFLTVAATGASAADQTIDISGNNKSSAYESYNTSISLPAGKTVDVKMARYCYFSSTISGSGTLNLYAGGERCYLGTEKGAAWPNWTGYKGDIHIYPFRENSSSAGFYGVVLSHGGKKSTAETALVDAKSGKVNPSMANNVVTLHDGAVICCEANTAGAGFRIGELWTDAGSKLMGYMKNGRSAYYLLGGLGTDATLAGDIVPASDNGLASFDDASTQVGIVKEGKGTYRITGKNNFVSGALRILEGRVMVNNDRAETERGMLRGGLGAIANENSAVAFVFGGGVLGGVGSIGGAVENYGTIEPGDDSVGLLTLCNYAKPTKNANLVVHPSSVLRFKIVSADSYDRLAVAGTVKYDSRTEDFGTSDKQPVISIALADDADLKVGDEFTVVEAKSKTGDWQFELRQPGRYTWEVVEATAADGYSVKLRVVSAADDTGGPGTEPGDDEPAVSTMGAFYDDGIDDKTDTNTLRYYAAKNGKNIGVALSTWKAGADEAGRQFNMLVAENEMKMDALQPSRGQFSFGSADALVTRARNSNMTMRGHCLVWHMQQPEWLSVDGKKNDKKWSRSDALAIMKNHITTVMQHFKGKVTEWDVVNECLDDDQSIVRSNPDGYKLRQTVWSLAIGDDYIDSAFVYAHRADPSAVLYLNDYDVEMQGTAKAVAFYNLIKRLRADDIPVDGAGLQCHFKVADVDSVKLDRTIRRFGDDGLKCIITELDMGVSSTSAKDLEEQARCYRVVTDIVLNNDNCPSMVVWGVKDNDSWRSAENPLLYNSAESKKPAWYAVRSALRHRTLVPASVAAPEGVAAPPASDAVYDLQGRRVAKPLRRGLYIKKGKKIFF